MPPFSSLLYLFPPSHSADIETGWLGANGIRLPQNSFILTISSTRHSSAVAVSQLFFCKACLVKVRWLLKCRGCHVQVQQATLEMRESDVRFWNIRQCQLQFMELHARSEVSHEECGLRMDLRKVYRFVTHAHHRRAVFSRGGGGWHKASVSDCLPLAAPIGLSPLLILTLCGSERVLVVSTEPPDDLSCWTTPGVGRPGDGLLPVPLPQGGGGMSPLCIVLVCPWKCGQCFIIALL